MAAFSLAPVGSAFPETSELFPPTIRSTTHVKMRGKSGVFEVWSLLGCRLILQPTLPDLVLCSSPPTPVSWGGHVRLVSPFAYLITVLISELKKQFDKVFRLVGMWGERPVLISVIPREAPILQGASLIWAGGWIPLSLFCSLLRKDGVSSSSCLEFSLWCTPERALQLCSVF